MEGAASTSLVYLTGTIHLLQSSYMGTGYGGLDSAARTRAWIVY